MEITFIGYGKLGSPLADHLQRLGHAVTLAAAAPQSKSLEKALARNPNLKVASPNTAVGNAEVVFLAIPYPAARQHSLLWLKNSRERSWSIAPILLARTSPIG